MRSDTALRTGFHVTPPSVLAIGARHGRLDAVDAVGSALLNDCLAEMLNGHFCVCVCVCVCVRVCYMVGLYFEPAIISRSQRHTVFSRVSAAIHVP